MFVISRLYVGRCHQKSFAGLSCVTNALVLLTFGNFVRFLPFGPSASGSMTWRGEKKMEKVTPQRHKSTSQSYKSQVKSTCKSGQPLLTRERERESKGNVRGIHHPEWGHQGLALVLKWFPESAFHRCTFVIDWVPCASFYCRSWTVTQTTSVVLGCRRCRSHHQSCCYPSCL